MFVSIPRWRMGCLALVVGLLSLPASSAMADGIATAKNPGYTFTFKAKHGWHITVTAYVCGSKHAGVNVAASKTGSHYAFSHSYYDQSPRKSGCRGSTTLASGKVHAYWGKLFYLKMSVKGAGAKTAQATPSGCTGVPGHQRPVKAHGTLRLRIHKRVLGSINKTKLKGVAVLDDASKNFNCKGGNHFPKSTFAFGSFGVGFLSATKFDKTGNTSVSVGGADNPSRKVRGSFGDSFTGAPFTFSKDLTSATVGSTTGFMSGSLSFSGTSTTQGCANGAWKGGTLKVHDGLAKTTLVGSMSAVGSVYKSTANCGG